MSDDAVRVRAVISELGAMKKIAIDDTCTSIELTEDSYAFGPEVSKFLARNGRIVYNGYKFFILGPIDFVALGVGVGNE